MAGARLRRNCREQRTAPSADEIAGREWMDETAGREGR
jgi:hypothetical protein